MFVLGAVVSGLMVGGVYALVAVGFTLILGVLKIVNFAYGPTIMMGMFGIYWLWAKFGLDPYLGMIPVAAVLFVLGYFTQNWLFEPFFKRERNVVVEPLSIILVGAGLWFIFENTALLAWGAEAKITEGVLSGKSFAVGEIIISTTRLMALIGGLIFCCLTYLLLNKTGFGRAVRAISQNRDASALSGIDVYRMYSLTNGLGTALAGIAGALLATFFYTVPTVGTHWSIMAFIIVVLGGMGSLPGAIIGAFIIGLVESVTSYLLTPAIAPVFMYLIFVVILVLRPIGLLGREAL
ncbi:MAG: branched-chain amino acid ABC transporter permease [Chloroflexota bacterium]